METTEKTGNETETERDICAVAVPRNRYQEGYVAGHKKGMEDCAAEIERLRALVKELADDLTDEVEGHYQGVKDHPAMARRYERDMSTVYKARRALEGK